jgi:hypothetical protein
MDGSLKKQVGEIKKKEGRRHLRETGENGQRLRLRETKGNEVLPGIS